MRWARAGKASLPPNSPLSDKLPWNCTLFSSLVISSSSSTIPRRRGQIMLREQGLARRGQIMLERTGFGKEGPDYA